MSVTSTPMNKRMISGLSSQSRGPSNNDRIVKNS